MSETSDAGDGRLRVVSWTWIGVRVTARKSTTHGSILG